MALKQCKHIVRRQILNLTHPSSTTIMTTVVLGSVVTDWAPLLASGPFVSHVLSRHALPNSAYTTLST